MPGSIVVAVPWSGSEINDRLKHTSGIWGGRSTPGRMRLTIQKLTIDYSAVGYIIYPCSTLDVVSNSIYNIVNELPINIRIPDTKWLSFLVEGITCFNVRIICSAVSRMTALPDPLS